MPAALTPWPLRVLLGRVAHEWETRHRIFDLPFGKFHHNDPTADLSAMLGGRRVATPIGPAAGPHTQLAQNIVLGWLAGARVFELKTVQVLDELEIRGRASTWRGWATTSSGARNSASPSRSRSTSRRGWCSPLSGSGNRFAP